MMIPDPILVVQSAIQPGSTTSLLAADQGLDLRPWLASLVPHRRLILFVWTQPLGLRRLDVRLELVDVDVGMRFGKPVSEAQLVYVRSKMSRNEEGAKVQWRELGIAQVLREVGGGDPNQITNLEKKLSVRRSGVAVGTALHIVCKAAAGESMALSMVPLKCAHFGWGA
jgi:hypothetical protein